MRTVTTGVVADELAAGSPPQDASVVSELEKLSGLPEGAEAEGQEAEGEEAEGEEAEGAEAEGEEAEGEEAEDEAPKGHRNEKIERRISELTAARKTAEEKATAAEQKALELEAAAGVKVGLHPSYVTADEARLLQEADALERREEELLANFEGLEHEDPAKSMTAEQVRREYARVRRESAVKVAAANAVYTRALEQQQADMKAGRELRLRREGLKKAPATLQKRTIQPPAAPARGLAGTPPVSSGKSRGLDEGRFVKAGGDLSAAAAELSNLAGD